MRSTTQQPVSAHRPKLATTGRTVTGQVKSHTIQKSHFSYLSGPSNFSCFPSPLLHHSKHFHPSLQTFPTASHPQCSHFPKPFISRYHRNVINQHPQFISGNAQRTCRKEAQTHAWSDNQRLFCTQKSRACITSTSRHSSGQGAISTSRAYLYRYPSRASTENLSPGPRCQRRH